MLTSILFKKKYAIDTLKDEYLEKAEEVLKDYSDIFSERDRRLFRQDFLEYLMNPLNALKLRVIILTNSNSLKGIIMFRSMEDSATYFRIDLVAVSKDSQNKGYGKALLKEAFRRIKKLGGKYVYLLTSNENYNRPTQNFYRKAGFERVGVLPDYYSDPHNKETDNCLIYMRTL